MTNGHDLTALTPLVTGDGVLPDNHRRPPTAQGRDGQDSAPTSRSTPRTSGRSENASRTSSGVATEWAFAVR